MTEDKPLKSVIDWEMIERHYRAGIRSLREMAVEGGVTEGAIRKRAKRDQWVRDLGAKIKAKADDLVRKAAVRTPGTQLTPRTETEVVNLNAAVEVQIRLSHRTDIADTRSLFRSLLLEVRAETDSLGLFQALGELLDTSGPDQTGTWRQDKLNELYKKVISTTGRIDGAKKLTEMLEKLVRLERQAFGIADTEDDKDGADQVLKSLGAKLRAQCAD